MNAAKTNTPIFAKETWLSRVARGAIEGKKSGALNKSVDEVLFPSLKQLGIESKDGEGNRAEMEKKKEPDAQARFCKKKGKQLFNFLHKQLGSYQKNKIPANKTTIRPMIDSMNEVLKFYGYAVVPVQGKPKR